MRVKDIMTRRVQVVRPYSTIKEAAQIMKVDDLGSLPVCQGDRLVGMVTDRDIAIGAVAEGKNPDRTPVRQVMRAGAIYGFEDWDVQEAVRVMEEKQVRRLMVLNRSKRLVGILSLGDLARKVHDANLTEALAEKVSAPR